MIFYKRFPIEETMEKVCMHQFLKPQSCYTNLLIAEKNVTPAQWARVEKV